jgi:hypothetical protein
MFQARARAGLNRGLDYEWIFIDGFTEEAVARLFHESPVLIFLSMEEGIPRMPLEAMRSGCLVAGRQAGPLKELPQFAFHCEPGESIPVVEFLERLVAAGPADLAHWTAVAQDTFEQSLHFTPQRGAVSWNSTDARISKWPDLPEFRRAFGSH